MAESWVKLITGGGGFVYMLRFPISEEATSLHTSCDFAGAFA